MRTDRVRRPRYRRVNIYVDELGQGVGWLVEFLEESDQMGSIEGWCKLPMPVSALLERVDQVGVRTTPGHVGWTDWGGGSPWRRSFNRIKIWLPRWSSSLARFGNDGSVQFPLGLTYDDLL